jgi:hypothetical protein
MRRVFVAADGRRQCAGRPRPLTGEDAVRCVAWIVAVALYGLVAEADGLPAKPNEIKTLTVEQAKALARQNGQVFLLSLTAVSDEAAEALARHDGPLFSQASMSAEAAASSR